MFVKIAAVQFDCRPDEKIKNLAKAVELLEKAGRDNVNIAALPMFFLSGQGESWKKELVVKYAEPIPGPTTDALAEVAKKYKMCIVGGSIFEVEKGKYYHTCPILDPKGKLLGKYRSDHQTPARVAAGLSSGTEYPVFETEFGKIGVTVGGDLDFPEIPRVFAVKGADIVFWLANLPFQWIDVCRSLVNCYAFVNSAYYVVANRTGIVEGVSYFGESRIVDPRGETLASAGTNLGGFCSESIVATIVDTELLKEMRKKLGDFINRRKPETYKLLTKT